jgi:glycosyltransferase involved in cell wall biosynthesis
LLQNYPNSELIVVDGGSTDSTVDVLRKYDPWLSFWVSERDRGQSHAINKGFERATGDWVGWQNSDDVYVATCFQSVLKASAVSNADILFGHTNLIDHNSKKIRTYYYAPFSLSELKYHGMNISNQSTFFSRRTLSNFNVNETLEYSMDADLFFRLGEKGWRFELVNEVLGAFRIHEASKSGQFGNSVGIAESIMVRKKFGVTQSNKPWNRQYVFRKMYFKLRKLFYLTIQGNIRDAIFGRRERISSH